MVAVSLIKIDLTDGADLVAVGGEDGGVLQLVESVAVHEEFSF